MARFENLGSVSEIDRYIYQNEDIYTWDREKIRDVQLRLIKDSFEYHYINCDDYRNYCKALKTEPAMIENYDDLVKIPLITSSVFKKKNVLSTSENLIVKKCTSSGTQGVISVVNRDEVTLNRFLGSVEETVDQMFHLDDSLFLNLGPSTDEAEDLWFSYVMSITDMIFPSLNFVVNDVFYPDRVIDSLMMFKDSYETLTITGAPIMYIRLLEYMEKNDITIEFGNKVFIITAGGWKKFSGEAISKDELYTKLKKSFIDLEETSIRDVLNMVELNTIWPECESKIKHVPPWVKVIIRSPYDMTPLDNNEMGLISFLDPTSTSYPSFILTSDFGKIVVEDECECGLKGTGIEIIRRVTKGQARGCALKMDKNYSGPGVNKYDI